MAMDNTTLHTFLLYVYPPSAPLTFRPSLILVISHCPTALRCVAVLGSWDNFSRPYPLELDSRGGCNIWKGCFIFSDIVCDGDLQQQTSKRDGPLKMGGTYWYYYKVDEDEERHNPAEESTTFCPLLPGQRLNVLDVPREGHYRSTSDTTSAFTRNPQDRYLTPVPPKSLKPLPTPPVHAGAESYPMPMPSPWTPRSATLAPTEGLLNPYVPRHARSASASPYMPSTPLFPDFKLLKDKLASKRAASRNRCGPKNRAMDISSPVLVSGGEDLNLIPLSEYRPSIEAIREAEAVTNARPTPRIRREFSPLASHPVDPDRDSIFAPAPTSAPAPARAALPTVAERRTRRRSQSPSTLVTSEFKVEQNRNRANSADTRRTRHYLFSNDPWLTSPKEHRFKIQDRVVEDDTPSAPTLSRSEVSLGPPTSDERPTSRHGNRGRPEPQQLPLDKELPPLPRYLIPAPLYACNSPTTNPPTVEEPIEEFHEEADEECLDRLSIQFSMKARSHFSTWTNESMTYSPVASDDEEDDNEEDGPISSPTFSSFTSNDSDMDAPSSQGGLLIRYSYLSSSQQQQEQQHPHTSTSTSVPEMQNMIPDDTDTDDHDHANLSSTPPQLSELRISTFGSDLFSPALNTAFSHVSSTSSSARSSRRQAACFGLQTFQYSLPADDMDSKVSLATAGARASGVSEGNALMEDFAFLGDAVL
ncbi:hypothetical protein PTNB73_05529 [Pyrenophora teres f. teres]|uniref:Uncharacterized protein n=1 Tax=Pyrenophora teres f. teres TaxID=97479 RepID=A0A6S6VZ68_9PLEO|nr:hypothetical protein HRS9139_04900 [Pyrenophora teres f. teres]KAE8841150.1 hypothetical protein PTNB85_04549 [Pyrenophora teres f. teres]KAE8864646.1 hypothetical protein PTNB29_04610 [Pyrenophora teres f. teres]KAE8867435.1 hypothetical protein PTNB73_05529 [Pyrenophora teres f. teres]CAE7030363.1 hypothetical protein PTTW11_04492 [Pyrenophora teres f. teres]